ncbi:MAG: hypothetical protein U0235_20840 [Polyangiaceae bacterium]
MKRSVMPSRLVPPPPSASSFNTAVGSQWQKLALQICCGATGLPVSDWFLVPQQ